jgi:hypothetical protein
MPGHKSETETKLRNPHGGGDRALAKVMVRSAVDPNYVVFMARPTIPSRKLTKW